MVIDINLAGKKEYRFFNESGIKKVLSETDIHFTFIELCNLSFKIKFSIASFSFSFFREK